MARLPTQGGDEGIWGNVLNDYLQIAHDGNGALRPITQSTIINLTSDLANKLSTSGGQITGSLVVTADITAGSFTTNTTSRSAFFKTTSSANHVVTIYQAGTSGVDVAAALNVVSDNPQSSAMYLSGKETNRGTLKIAHIGQADATDSSGAALSIDLQTAGSAARGIFITSTSGSQTGDPIVVRFNSRDDFVVKSSGRVGIGLALAATPAGKLEVAQNDDSTPGISLRANSTSAQNLIELKRSSDGAVRTRIDAQCQFVTQQIAFFAGAGLQLGATSTDFGGGSGVVSIKNATSIPGSNPTGGGILYVEAGALKYRGSSGTITTLASA